MGHDTFSRNTRNQLMHVFDALRERMMSPDPPKRPIEFVTPADKGSKKTLRARGKTRPRSPEFRRGAEFR